MAERFIIRNYGPSRNLKDGKGSYIFIERDRVRATSDPNMAKLFATYPQIHVTDRGEEFGRPAILPQPPVGPEPPEDDDDKVKDKVDQGEDQVEEAVAIDYETLRVSDLQEIATERELAKLTNRKQK